MLFRVGVGDQLTDGSFRLVAPASRRAEKRQSLPLIRDVELGNETHGENGLTAIRRFVGRSPFGDTKCMWCRVPRQMTIS
jgi:hypothetical protein